jgi:RNA polymerase sigma-70 factor (ECF subfamily)
MRGDSPSEHIDADGDLISQSLARPERFSSVFDRHYPAVHRYVARRAGREAADEVASRTFVAAFERRATFRRESTSALPWLLGIATNLLHEHHRADRRARDAISRLRSERPREPRTAHRPDAEQHLAEGLATLDVRQRDALLLFAWAELSYEEIADALDVPLGTVRSRLSRARAHLRAHLQAAPRAPHLDPSPENT